MRKAFELCRRTRPNAVPRSCAPIYKGVRRWLLITEFAILQCGARVDEFGQPVYIRRFFGLSLTGYPNRLIVCHLQIYWSLDLPVCLVNTVYSIRSLCKASNAMYRFYFTHYFQNIVKIIYFALPPAPVHEARPDRRAHKTKLKRNLKTKLDLIFLTIFPFRRLSQTGAT